MNNQQNVLILDDEEGFRKEIGEYLSHREFHVLSAGLPSEALDLLDNNPIDIAVFDIRLPEMDGITLLKKVKENYPEVEVIMMTGYGEMESVIKALRYGAADYLNKPFKFSEISETIERVTKYQTIKKGIAAETNICNDLLNTELKLVGESKDMKHINGLIQKIARTDDTTVLISGESGTGKELIARAIHLLSDRCNKRFIPVNCSSIPKELFENEFFGHVKGSYTDAKQDQKGLFEVADKGILFLDEIGDLELNIQSKLLRVIEEKKVSRIGQYNEKKVDVRVITATNQNLEEMVMMKKFRIDLYHRINLFRIDIPPLRDRMEDIPLLFDFFVEVNSKKLGKSIKKVEKSIIYKLMEYDFPGNVRELKNLIESAIILCENNILKEDCFRNLNSEAFKQRQMNKQSNDTLDLNTLEKKSIIKALKSTRNNKSKAANMLHVSRQALDRKIKKYNIRLN